MVQAVNPFNRFCKICRYKLHIFLELVLKGKENRKEEQEMGLKNTEFETSCVM